MKLLIPAILLLSLLATISCGGRRIPIVPATTLVPAADGSVKMGTDSNGNTSVELNVKHLAKPESLTPPATSYVVWFQSSGTAPQNKGVLRVDDELEGNFKAVTPFKVFALMVTAENDPRASSPSSTVILKQQLSR